MEGSKRLGKRLTGHYAMIQMIYIMGYCSIFSFASVFLLSRGFTNAQVGITLALASGLGLLFQPFAGAFADQTTRMSLRSILAVMLLLVVIFSFLLLVLPAIVLPIALLYMLLITFFSTQIALVTSLSMEHINSGVPINFSLARGVGSFAYAVLSFLLGYLVDDYGAGVIMLVNIGLGLIGTALVLTFRRPNLLRSVKAESEAAASGLISFAKEHKRFMAVVFSASLLFISHTLITTYTIQIVQRVGGDSSDMGTALALSAFLELPAMAVFPVIYKKMRNAGTLMKISGAFFVLKAIVTLLAPNMFWINAAQCLQFFAYALFLPASVYYVNQVISDQDKNKGQACMGMTIGISGLLGNLIGGYILDTSGGVLLMLTVGIGCSLLGLILLMYFDKTKVTTSSEAQNAN